MPARALLLVLAALVARPALAEPVFFPAAGVTIDGPKGFQLAADWEGFGQRSTGASILAMTVDAPYTALAAGFTAENLAAKGWALLSREDVVLDGQPGVLIHFSQPAQGQTYLKWSLITGTDTRATMVTGTFPEAQAHRLSAPLMTAVLSTRAAAGGPSVAPDTLGLAVTPGPLLVETPGVSGLLLYTKDGVMPAASPVDPIFIVARSLGAATVDTPQAAAELRLHQTAETDEIAIRSTTPLTVAGLAGFESVATAVDAKSRVPLVLYQLYLVDGDSTVLIQGLAGARVEDTWLPVFRATARTLVRTPR